MHRILWLLIALWSTQNQANEIRNAETQRQKAEQQLKTLKQDVQLDTKKLKIIESELNRLNVESKPTNNQLQTGVREVKKEEPIG
jgi:septal ring factor EnvC (AmiA/AmiB activator)